MPQSAARQERKVRVNTGISVQVVLWAHARRRGTRATGLEASAQEDAAERLRTPMA